MTKKVRKKKKDTSITRPPIVAFVGHIDHGKTTLLDKIRQTQIASGEPGGITQHIGAYKIKLDKGNEITFIDTPGHAAFSKMRARGVEVTDLVILVVAADEGVQDQTEESYKYIQAAEVPFLVAINKVDLPGVNIDKAKGQLSEIGIIPEDYGGDIVIVSVSAQTGEGIDDLLEMINLMAEMEELTADPEGDLEGVIIESSLDRQRGALATIIVKNGRLEKGEEIYAEKTPAKVKALIDWKGNQVDRALPGDPVEILGFKEAPPVGSIVSKTPQERRVAEEKISEEEGKLKVILKADVSGSIEAIKANLPEEVRVISSGVGPVTERDVFMGQSTGANIYAFNIKLNSAVENLAKQSQVEVIQADIIYELFEEIEKRLEEERDPLENKQILGRAEILAEFKMGNKLIAGGQVVEGKIYQGQKIFLQRNDEVFGKSVLASLRHGKEDIETANKGQEFGAVFSPALDFRKGDVIISYKDEKAD